MKICDIFILLGIKYNMKKILKLSVFVLLVITSILFTGCASVSYSTIKSDDGSITETVVAVFDDTELGTTNSDIILKKSEIQQKVDEAISNKYNDFGRRMTDMKNAYHDEGNREMEIYYANLLTQVKITRPFWSDDNLNCVLIFDTEDAYMHFYNIKEQNFSNIVETEKWLYTKVYFKGSSGYGLNNGLYATLYNELGDLFSSTTETGVNLSYSYLARSRRYHSNADLIEYTSDGYLHTWYISSENPNEEIYFYVNVANRSNFYLLSIIISLIICIILSIIAIIKIKINKKKNNRLILKIINK